MEKNRSFKSHNTEELNPDERIEALLHEMNAKLDQILKILSPKKHSEIVEEWLPEKDVQQLVGLKTTSLWTLRRLGKIKYSKIGNKIFYSKKSILEYFEKMEQ